MKKLHVGLRNDTARASTSIIGFLSVPASGLPTGATFSRATVETVRTGTSALLNLAIDTCGIGRESDTAEWGYSIEGTAGGNSLVATEDPRNPGSWSGDSAGTTTNTPGQISPSGDTGAHQLHQNSGSNYVGTIIHLVGATSPVYSIWLKSSTGGAAFQSLSSYGGPVTEAHAASLSTTWSRLEYASASNADVNVHYYPLLAIDCAPYGGLPAGARDCCMDYLQCDRDGAYREFSPNAVRPAGVFLLPYQSSGRVYGYTRFRSKCASTAIGAGRLWDANDGGANALALGPTTWALYYASATISGASLPFAAMQTVEIAWELGGGLGTVLQMRVGGSGVWTTLYTGAPIANTAPATVQLFKNLDVFCCAFACVSEQAYGDLTGLTTLYKVRDGAPVWGGDFASADMVLTSTNATELLVLYDNSRVTDTTFNDIGLATDGTHTSYPTLTTPAGAAKISVSGAHTYRLRGGGNVATFAGGVWTSTQCAVQRVRVRGNATAVAPTAPLRQVVVLGDSIAEGAHALHLSEQGAFQQIRDAGTYAVALCTAGSLSVQTLTDAGAVTQTATTIAAALHGTSKNIVWIELGYNDFYAAVNTTTFGANYGALLDALHAAAPTAVIVAQHPIPTASGDATLATYRTAITTAQSSRSAWCTLVAGGTWSDITMYDVAHPDTAGQATYAGHIVNALNLL